MSNNGVLSEGQIDTTYIITKIDTDDNDMKDFLFSLGCYEGEQITIISRLNEQFVVSIKDARYSIDKELAECISI